MIFHPLHAVQHGSATCDGHLQDVQRTLATFDSPEHTMQGMKKIQFTNIHKYFLIEADAIVRQPLFSCCYQRKPMVARSWRELSGGLE